MYICLKSGSLELKNFPFSISFSKQVRNPVYTQDHIHLSTSKSIHKSSLWPVHPNKGGSDVLKCCTLPGRRAPAQFQGMYSQRKGRLCCCYLLAQVMEQNLLEPRNWVAGAYFPQYSHFSKFAFLSSSGETKIHTSWWSELKQITHNYSPFHYFSEQTDSKHYSLVNLLNS